MSRSVKVTWENRLGEISALEIKKRLSYFSVPTKYKEDIGIDFYCELLEEDSPTLTFYVQAKGTEHFDSKGGASIKKSTIIYWLLRPSPVFLIIHDENIGECYWISIEDNRYKLLEKMGNKSSETIYIKVDKSKTLEEGRHKNPEFIRKIKEDLVSVKQFFGHPTFRGEGYVKQVPLSPRSKAELIGARETARASLYSLFNYYFYIKRDVEISHVIVDFLTKFDKSHYNHFVWLARINKLMGNKPEAKRNLRRR